MKDALIIEELAILQGFDVERIRETAPKRGSMTPRYVEDHPKGGCRFIPDYLNSHDAIQPLIDGFSLEELTVYNTHLLIAVDPAPRESARIYQATPRQKCEAVLRALGKWEAES